MLLRVDIKRKFVMPQGIQGRLIIENCDYASLPLSMQPRKFVFELLYDWSTMSLQPLPIKNFRLIRTYALMAPANFGSR